LDGLRLKHDTGKLARFFIEDFSQFASARKPADQRVLFIVDELSAIAASANLADIVERTRTFGVSAVLAPQVLEGMRDSTHTERVVGSTHTTFLHSVPNPEYSVRAAGMREHYEPSIENRDGLPRLGTASPKRRPRVDPDEVRRLGVGCCFVIGSGYAAKVAINKAPHTEPLKLPDGAHTKTEAPVRTHTEPIRP
jgi:type IV secretory pathway TraG/TraD family ATPase VirD4